MIRPPGRSALRVFLLVISVGIAAVFLTEYLLHLRLDFEEAHYIVEVAYGSLIVVAGAAGLYWERLRMERRYWQFNQILGEQEERYRTLFEYAEDGIVVTDGTGRILDINKTGAGLVDYAPEEMVGNYIQDYVVPEDIVHDPSPLRLLEAGELVRLQRRMVSRDGSVKPVRTHARRLPDGRTIGVFRDISEQIEREAELSRRVDVHTKELKEANERLKDLDRLRAQFVEDISHELRHPIANLVFYVDLLERRITESKSLAYVSACREQVEHLRRIVDGVLELLHTHGDLATGEPTALNEYIRVVAAEHRELIRHAGKTLRLLLASDLPPVICTEAALGQIIGHLLDNAIKYAARGTITVATSWNRERDRVMLQVCDTGRGIPAEELPYVFERFYRGRTVAQGQIPGSGIGLSVVREVAELYDGRVEIYSSPQEGTCVQLLLRPAA